MSDIRVLVVENDALVALALRLDLEKHGYHVCGIAASAEEALALAERERPTVVLMDISLYGELDGIDAAEQIGARCGIPIIYMTGYDSPDVRRQAEVTHPIGFLMKPVHFRKFKEIIETRL